MIANLAFIAFFVALFQHWTKEIAVWFAFDFYVVNCTCGLCIRGVVHLSTSKFLCSPGPPVCCSVNYYYLKDMCKVLLDLVFKNCLHCVLGPIVIRSSSVSTPAKSGGLASQVARFRGANSPRGLCPPGSFWCWDKAQATQEDSCTFHSEVWGWKKASRPQTFTPPTPPSFYMPRGNVTLRVISQLQLVWTWEFPGTCNLMWHLGKKHFLTW